MPKPVKKKPATKKKSTAKRPSVDPNLRAHQLMRAMEARQAEKFVQPAEAIEIVAPSFEEQFKARMAELGSKGGKASGAKRMQNLTPSKRKEIARLAAKARWKSKPSGS